MVRQLVLIGILGVVSVFCVGGCNEELKAAYDAFRAQAPPICKDYCEEKVVCEWPYSEGPMETDAFSSAVRRCITLCSSYAVEGAYVYRPETVETYERYYDDYLTGNTLMDGFECIYYLGAYRCVDMGDTNEHKFNPPVNSYCVASNDCLAQFGLDYSVRWQQDSSGIGGSCIREGNQYIDAIFF